MDYLEETGAGKTTFFNCLNEDLNIDEGEFFIADNGKQRKMEAEDIGYVLSTREFDTFFLKKFC